MVLYNDKNGNADTSQAASASAGVFPRILTKTKLMDTWVGASLTAERYGDILKAMKDSDDGDVIYCYERYQAASLFSFSLTESLTSTLVDKSIMTSSERTALFAAWPKD